MDRFKICALALALGLVAAAPAEAQIRRAAVGVTAGATVADLEGGFVNSGSRWGFMGGIFGALRTSRNSTVGLEVSYAQKGGKDVARLDYIDIPLTVGAVIPTDNDRLNFNFYTGIGLGIKVSCNEEAGGLVSNPCDRAKGTEWTWPVGLAFIARTGNGKYFGLDARYSIGISDALENSAIRNRSWQFRALFGVPMG